MAHAVSSLTILPDQSYAIYVDTEDYRQTRTLASGSAENIQVPTGAKYVVFGCTGNFAARYNATTTGGSAASFGDVTDGSGCEVNPTVRFLRSTVKAISVICRGATADLSATFYN